MSKLEIDLIKIVDLSHVNPVAESKTRWIYEHPDSIHYLIKINKSEMGCKTGGWFSRKKDFFQYKSGLLRDYSHFVESRYCFEGLAVERILPIFGVIQTNLGLGLLVQSARDASGKLAPTARSLLLNKEMSEKRIDDLRRLVKGIVDSPLNFADINLWNFVLQDAGTEKERFVLIDGLGDRTFIPVQKWFYFIRKRKKKSFQKFLERSLNEAGYE